MADHVFTKCAWRLIPFIALLYLVNYIDRTNAGFAALTMNKDLGFSSGVFGLGAGIFFIGYSLFQVPANVILERIGAQRWIFSIMAASGGCQRAGNNPDRFLFNLLVSQARSCVHHGPIPDRAFAILRYWGAAFQLYNGDGRHGRPARLAMAVFVGRGAGILTRVRRAQIFAGWPATRPLGSPKRKRKQLLDAWRLRSQQRRRANRFAVIYVGYSQQPRRRKCGRWAIGLPLQRRDGLVRCWYGCSD